MIGKALDSKEASRILKDNGFYKVRQRGSHVIYKNDNGKSCTITTAKPLSQKTWKRECKKVGIEVI